MGVWRLLAGANARRRASVARFLPFFRRGSEGPPFFGLTDFSEILQLDYR